MVLCHDHGQSYSALHNGNQCACLSNLNHLIEASEDMCNITCSVNRHEVCGGRFTMSVYQVVAHAAVQSDQANADSPQKGESEQRVQTLNVCKTWSDFHWSVKEQPS